MSFFLSLNLTQLNSKKNRALFHVQNEKPHGNFKKTTSFMTIFKKLYFELLSFFLDIKETSGKRFVKCFRNIMRIIVAALINSLNIVCSYVSLYVLAKMMKTKKIIKSGNFFLLVAFQHFQDHLMTENSKKCVSLNFYHSP